MLKTPILLVEDSPTDALIVKHALRQGFEVEHSRTLEAAQEHLRANAYAAVICDCFLPGATAVDMLHWLDAHRIDVPMIVMSGQGDERVATDVLKLGAYDYIVKSEETLSSLPMVIRQAIRQHELEHRARILQQIVENASDCIITMDMDGVILTANRAVRPMLGYAPEALVGMSVTRLFADGARPEDAFKMFDGDGNGRSWNGELRARRKDGSLFPVHMSTSILRDPAGKSVRLIGIARDMTERNELLEKLRRLSVTDNLTNLCNHRSFHDRLRYEFVRARRYEEPLSCIMIDVDYFKAVNDTYGHIIGDQALKSLADIIAKATRSSDIVARYGGEEFAVLLPNTEMAGAWRCAENIWESVRKAEIATTQGALRLTVSAGVAALASDVRNEEDLLRRADEALLVAKRGGRNMVKAWQPDDSDDTGDKEIQGEDLAGITRSMRSLIQPAMGKLVEAARPLVQSLYRRTPELQEHAVRVRECAMALAHAADIRGEEEIALKNAAEFHDIGHALTPRALWPKHSAAPADLPKPFRDHVLVGEQLLAELKLFAREEKIVRHHHERYDGLGYPDGLAGEGIPLTARVLAIAEAYQTMIEGGPWGTALSARAARKKIAEGAGTLYDPRLTELFLGRRSRARV